MKKTISKAISHIFSVGGTSQQYLKDQGTVSSEYWTKYNVTLHHNFSTKEDSLEYFHWRNDQYFNYINLMPVSGFDGKIILDFGCGPGHDIIGFGTFSKCKRLVGVDVSPSSIAEAKSRQKLHGISAELIAIESGVVDLPFEDSTFDHIHSSGVLHHTPDPVGILKELRRVLKPSGSIYVMVYNYDSLWVHLYVAYHRMIIQGLYREDTLREQFRHSTDGENCPISNCYRQSEWIALCAEAGFEAHFSGAAVSVFELSLSDKRFAAIMDRRLPAESRAFLTSLEFDRYGAPKYRGHYAGVDGCYRLVQS